MTDGRRRFGGAPAAPSGAAAAAAASPVAVLDLAAGMGSAAIGAACIMAAIGVSDLVLGPVAVRPALLAWSVVASAIVGLLGVRQLRRGFPTRVLPHVAGLVVVTCVANAVAHLALTRDPVQTVYLLLSLVGGGPLLPLRRWLLVADGVAVVGFTVVAAQEWPAVLWPQFAFTLAMTVALAHVLHATRSRQHAQLQELADALSRQARIDPLTGLLNRLGLAAAGDGLLAAGGAQGGLVLGVVCVDVDRFKAVNDELGHAAGDAVLVEVADRLGSLVGDGDVVARLGGDEFVLLLPGTGPGGVELVAHRVRIQLTGTAGALALPWTVSAGSASGAVRDAAGVEQLLRSADLRMYDDKQVRRRGLDRRPVVWEPGRPPAR